MLGEELFISSKYKISPNTIANINIPTKDFANIVKIQGKQLNLVRQIIVAK